MRWDLRGKVLPVISFLVFVIFASQSAHAELIVTGSTHPDIKVGTKLPDNTSLRVPEGVTVNILKTPENETFTLQGLFVGTLEEYKKKKTCRWLDRIFGRCGKDGQRDEPVGGVRSIRAPEKAEQ